MRRSSISFALGFVLLFSAQAHPSAAELTRQQLLEKINELQKRIEALESKNEKLKLDSKSAPDSRVTPDEKVLSNTKKPCGTEPGRDAKAVSSSSTHKENWADRINFFGDLRLRFEEIRRPGWTPAVDNRARERIRTRLGMNVKTGTGTGLRFRLATSESRDAGRGADPVSTNQTLTNAFSKKSIWLDLAQIDHHPEKTPGLHVSGGKMELPFITPGKSDLVWDHDLTPEGIIAKYCKSTGNHELNTTLGSFITMERANGGESSLFAAQVSSRHSNPARKTSFLGGISYFDHTNVEGRPVFDWQNANNSYGNTTNNNNYVFDYNLAEIFVEAGREIRRGSSKIPVSVFADFVKNLARNVDENKGWLAGFSVGKLDRPGSRAFRYNYRKLEKDAVLGAFCDSDSWGGGTDGRGHRFSLEVASIENISGSLTYFLNKACISATNPVNRNADYERLQLDINIKF